MVSLFLKKYLMFTWLSLLQKISLELVTVPSLKKIIIYFKFVFRSQNFSSYI